MSKMANCRSCKRAIAAEAKVCPLCGQPDPIKKPAGGCAVVIVVLVCFFIIKSCMDVVQETNSPSVEVAKPAAAPTLPAGVAVPYSDGATYLMLSAAGPKTKRIVHGFRRGSSGDTWSIREFNCVTKQVRYLATSDTEAGLKSSKPDPKMGDLVPGSSASAYADKACSQ